jgi:hypothetical protein
VCEFHTHRQARKGEMRNKISILVGKSEEKKAFGIYDWKEILYLFLKETLFVRKWSEMNWFKT